MWGRSLALLGHSTCGPVFKGGSRLRLEETHPQSATEGGTDHLGKIHLTEILVLHSSLGVSTRESLFAVFILWLELWYDHCRPKVAR